jgi:hypothetical protein
MDEAFLTACGFQADSVRVLPSLAPNSSASVCGVPTQTLQNGESGAMGRDFERSMAALPGYTVVPRNEPRPRQRISASPAPQADIVGAGIGLSSSKVFVMLC